MTYNYSHIASLFKWWPLGPHGARQQPSDQAHGPGKNTGKKQKVCPVCGTGLASTNTSTHKCKIGNKKTFSLTVPRLKNMFVCFFCFVFVKFNHQFKSSVQKPREKGEETGTDHITDGVWSESSGKWSVRMFSVRIVKDGIKGLGIGNKLFNFSSLFHSVMCWISIFRSSVCHCVPIK